MTDKKLILILLSFCFTLHASAKDFPSKDTSLMNSLPSAVNRIYIANGLDGIIFSTASVQRPGLTDRLGTLRFSAFFNMGCTFNFDIDAHTGIYTGLDLKNIGFIEKRNDSTIKRRTYNLGVPVGIKFGQLRSKNYFFAGIGLDMPVNYKEKGFVSRGDKQKFNEWFSDRTPAFMPYVFGGIAVNGTTVKVQYYLNNFLNPEFEQGSIAPYSGYNVHLFLISFGRVMVYHKHTSGLLHMKDGKRNRMIFG